VLDTIGVAAVVVSVLLLAWQSYLLRKQTELQTQVALATAGDDNMALLHGVLGRLVDNPALRPYFYEGVVPAHGASGGAVATVAEMLADCVESGCETANSLRFASPRLAGWPAYGQFLLQQSPVLNELVSTQPEWYPRLHALRTKLE